MLYTYIWYESFFDLQLLGLSHGYDSNVNKQHVAQNQTTLKIENDLCRIKGYRE